MSDMMPGRGPVATASAKMQARHQAAKIARLKEANAELVAALTKALRSLSRLGALADDVELVGRQCSAVLAEHAPKPADHPGVATMKALGDHITGEKS